MRFRGKVYQDSNGRLKVVVPPTIPRGEHWIHLSRIDGKPADLVFKTTVTKNNKASNKFRIHGFNEIHAGSEVEGRIAETRTKNEDPSLRCRWCGQRCGALINDLCDQCFTNFNSPTPTPYRAHARGRVGRRPQAKHPNLRAASTAHNRGAPGIFSMERVSSGKGIPAGRVSPSREPLPEAAPEVKR